MALYLEDKLFHTVKAHKEHFYIKSKTFEERMAIEQELLCEEMLLKLDHILSVGAILSRTELNNRYPNLNIAYCSAHYSGDDDTISFARHKNTPINYVEEKVKLFGDENTYYYDNEYGYWLRHFKSWQSEDAYLIFAACGISLVFDNELLNDCIKGKYGAIEHEVLFKKEVPLDLLKGISFPTWNAPLVQPFFGFEEPSKEQFTQEEYVKYNFMRNILELMKKYNLNIPLVALEDGEEFQENNVYTKKLEKIGNKFIKY